MINNGKDDIINYKNVHPFAYLELGKIHRKQGREEAEQELKKCIEIDKDKTPNAHLEVGRLYKEQEN